MNNEKNMSIEEFVKMVTTDGKRWKVETEDYTPGICVAFDSATITCEDDCISVSGGRCGFFIQNYSDVITGIEMDDDEEIRVMLDNASNLIFSEGRSYKSYVLLFFACPQLYMSTFNLIVDMMWTLWLFRVLIGTII